MRRALGLGVAFLALAASVAVVAFAFVCGRMATEATFAGQPPASPRCSALLSPFDAALVVPPLVAILAAWRGNRRAVFAAGGALVVFGMPLIFSVGTMAIVIGLPLLLAAFLLPSPSRHVRPDVADTWTLFGLAVALLVGAANVLPFPGEEVALHETNAWVAPLLAFLAAAALLARQRVVGTLLAAVAFAWGIAREPTEALQDFIPAVFLAAAAVVLWTVRAKGAEAKMT